MKNLHASRAAINGHNIKPAAEIVQFPPAQKRRGRPKVIRTPTPCRDSFDMVAMALKGIKDGIWPAAKERVRLVAARDRRLTAADQAVLSVYMAEIRRSTGAIRLTVTELAADTGYVERTIRRALEHLIDAGYVLPRQKEGAGIVNRCAMTLPCMVTAAAEEEQHRAAAAALDLHRTRTRKSPRPGQTNPPTLTKKSAELNLNVRVEDAGDIENARESTGFTEITEDQRASARSAEHQTDDQEQKASATVPRYVSEDALDQVRLIAPGWDRQDLLRRFMAWEGSSEAVYLDQAFLAWVREVTKGRQPGDLPAPGPRRRRTARTGLAGTKTSKAVEPPAEGPMPDKTTALRKYAAAKHGRNFARAWIDPIRCEGYDDGVLLLRAPYKWFPTHFDDHYRHRFWNIALAVFPDLRHWKWVHDRPGVRS